MICCAAIGLAGCWPLELTDDTEQVLGYTPNQPSQTPSTDSDSSVPDPVDTFTESEPNDTWEQVESVPFGGSVELVGSISAGGKDSDIFELGSAAAGQRLQADLVNHNADIQIGFFDAQGRIIAFVDPISATAGPRRVDVVLPESTTTLYVVLATRSMSDKARPYSVRIALSSDVQSVSPRAQAVVLVFHGASEVQIGSRNPVNVPVFDIADINVEYSGQTEFAIERLMQIVREDYAGLNVRFYRDSDSGIPESNVTTIYFGTSDTRLLGLADNVDPFNGDRAQSAIIYTDTFSLFNQLQPGFDATVQVLANVTSHEVGHLLGLRHTADVDDLMDVTATARRMLADQWFKMGALHGSVLPTGVQDAPAMLAWSIGGSLQEPSSAKQIVAQRALAIPSDQADFYIPRSLLADCGCAECDAQPR